MTAEPEAATPGAYELRAMPRTCVLAFDHLEDRDPSGEAASLRVTLEVAERLAADLIDAVEGLERLAKVGPLHGPRDAA